MLDADVGAFAVKLDQLFGSERIQRQLLGRGILSSNEPSEERIVAPSFVFVIVVPVTVTVTVTWSMIPGARMVVLLCTYTYMGVSSETIKCSVLYRLTSRGTPQAGGGQKSACSKRHGSCTDYGSVQELLTTRGHFPALLLLNSGCAECKTKFQLCARCAALYR